VCVPKILIAPKIFVTIANPSRGASGIGASPASEGAESPTKARRGAERERRRKGDGRARARRRYDIARCKLQFCCEIIIKYIMPSRLLPQPPLPDPLFPHAITVDGGPACNREKGKETKRRERRRDERRGEERRVEERSGAASR